MAEHCGGGGAQEDEAAGCMVRKLQEDSQGLDSGAGVWQSGAALQSLELSMFRKEWLYLPGR